MKTILTLAWMRIRITLRNKAFLFFSLFMPMGIFFAYCSLLAKGSPDRINFWMGPILSFTVMGTFWGLSMQLVTWREQGILRRFRLAPISPASMIASSIVANYALILPTVLLELGLARFVYHVTNFGNLFSVFLFVILGITSFGALGLIVASVTNTTQETQIINQLLWFALIFLSGATVPLAVMPKAVQRVGLFLPSTYLVSGLQRALVYGKGFLSLGVEMFSLVGLGSARVYYRFPALPLGARSENAAERQTLGSGHNSTFRASWLLGKPKWPIAFGGRGHDRTRDSAERTAFAVCKSVS